MSQLLESVPLPMRLEPSGVIRIGGTRVTLETVIISYQEGGSAEEIVDWYPALKLADVHAVIAYYLNRRDEVDAYLAERERIQEEVKREIESHYDPEALREKLLARRSRTGG